MSNCGTSKTYSLLYCCISYDTCKNLSYGVCFCWVEVHVLVNFWHFIPYWFMCVHLHVHREPKNPTFLQYLWLLLTNFNGFITVTIINDQSNHIWNKICHLSFTVLLHYCVKCEQVQFCENLLIFLQGKNVVVMQVMKIVHFENIVREYYC